MKTILPVCILITALFLSGCQSGPKTLAEKYMELVCEHDKILTALNDTETEKEQTRLQTELADIRRQLNQTNAKILKKYQGNSKAMETIRKVTETYQCKED